MAGCKAFIRKRLWGGDTLAGWLGEQESGGLLADFCFFCKAGMEFAERLLSFQQVIHNTRGPVELFLPDSISMNYMPENDTGLVSVCKYRL